MNSTITNFKPQNKMKNTNLIAGSIALAKTNEDPAIVEQSDSMTAIVNYGSMTQVQYLEPYKESEGIKKQNWKLLDNYTFENAKKDKTPLICRVVKVTNTVASNQKVEMKPLSSLFTLGDIKIKNTNKIKQPRKAVVHSEIAREIAIYGEEVLYSKNVPLLMDTKSTEGKPTLSRKPIIKKAPTGAIPRNLRTKKGLGY